MKRISAVSALGIGALLALTVPGSAIAAPTNSIHDTARTGLHLDAPSGITADIQFGINYDAFTDDPPLVADVTGVAVDGGIELPAQQMFYDDGEDDYCTSPDIDIAEDLSSVTVTGRDEDCPVQVAQLYIVLHDGEFGTYALGTDALFSLYEQPPVQLQGSGGGLGSLGQGLHFALVEVPSVQDAGTNGAEFGAYWEGTGLGLMTGVTTFLFAVAADGAEPVPADPDFTG